MASLANYVAAPAQPAPYTTQPTPDQTVQGSLAAMLDPNSAYIQNARQQGVEFAAERGGLNSSIAAGASERAAIQAAQPLVEDSLKIQQQRDALAGQNWLDTQDFNRTFQGQIAMMPVVNAYNMMNMVQQQSLMDPALYSPDVISGYTNFFNDNMKNIMDSVMHNTANTGGSAATGGGP